MISSALPEAIARSRGVTVYVVLFERYWVMGLRPRGRRPGFSRCVAGTGWSRDAWGAVRCIRAIRM